MEPHLTSQQQEKKSVVDSKRKTVTFKYFDILNEALAVLEDEYQNPKEATVVANSEQRSVSLKSLDKVPQKPQRRRSSSFP